MAAIVTLVSDPDDLQLDDATLLACARALRGEPEILSPAEAAAFQVEHDDHKALAAQVRQLVKERKIDVAVTAAEPRRRRLLLSDMDSTIITTECIDELADRLGIRAEVAAITQRAMNGELDFVSSVKARVALLKGLDAGVIQDILASRIHLMPGAATLVRTMRAHGAYTALVSGGFIQFTHPVAAWAGFDEDRANNLDIVDGKLTGELLPPLLDPDAKRRTLLELMDRFGLSIADTLAVGDGANDIPMLQTAGLGVGFRPHARVAGAVGTVVLHGDLTALLYFQGYPKSAFVP